MSLHRFWIVPLFLGLWTSLVDAQATPPAPAADRSPHAEVAASQPEAAQVAMPSQAAQDEYYKVVAGAIAEFDAGRFAEARSLFLRAHELWPSARTWRTLGMTAFELRMYPNAQAELQAALDDPRRPLDAGQRAQVVTLLEQTRHLVGRYRLQLSPPTAELSVDGTRIPLAVDQPLLLAVGQHELRLRAPGYRELHFLLVVQGREDEQRALALEPEAPAAALAVVPPPADSVTLAASAQPRAEPRHVESTLPTYAWIAAGVGAAGVVTYAVAGGLSLSRKHGLDDHCPGQVCTDAHADDIDSAKRAANVATAGLIVGAVGLATATVLWLSHRHAERKHDSTRVTWSPLGLRGSF